MFQLAEDKSDSRRTTREFIRNFRNHRRHTDTNSFVDILRASLYFRLTSSTHLKFFFILDNLTKDDLQNVSMENFLRCSPFHCVMWPSLKSSSDSNPELNEKKMLLHLKNRNKLCTYKYAIFCLKLFCVFVYFSYFTADKIPLVQKFLILRFSLSTLALRIFW